MMQVWSHKEYPLIPVGRLVLNRNPVNYFAEVEQIAFDPSNMPPGIEPSPDKMLQVKQSLMLCTYVRCNWTSSHAFSCCVPVSLFRVDCFPTLTHIDTGWVPTTCSYPSTAPSEPVWPTTSVTVRCAWLTTKVSRLSDGTVKKLLSFYLMHAPLHTVSTVFGIRNYSDAGLT